MSGTRNRASQKIPALAAIALMTALTGSILPAERVQASPSGKESASGFAAVSSKGDVRGMWTFIEARAASTAPATVTVWLRRLEAVQDKRLPALEEALSDEPVYQALMNTDGIYGDWQPGTRTGNAQADKLLVEIEKNGYVLDSTEGYLFPKIDYMRYMKQASQATARYADYLTIRSDETRGELTKDAGLMVSWEELLERAERQSVYLTRYPASPETPIVQRMYRQSLYIVLFGTDNVPLFDYETRIIEPDAKSAYAKQIRKSTQSPFAKLLRNYVRVLERNNGKLTKSVETFREVRDPWKE